MLNAPPPPLCRANSVDWYVTAQGATQGLMIGLGVYAHSACRLPVRPQVEILVAGRRARVKTGPFALGKEEVPRRTIRPKQPASVIVRWENWCGAPGPVTLRLRLGGVTVLRQLGSKGPAPPICIAPGLPSTVLVSRFVRR